MISIGQAAMPVETAELTGYLAAVSERVARLECNGDRPRPVVLPTYGGARRLPNLTALLALLLRRYGVPVLLHGPGEARGEFGRVTTAAVLRELGVEPVATMAEAQQRLAHEAIAYAPIALLAPGLLEWLELRRCAHFHDDLHSVVNLIDPFEGASFRVVSVLREKDLPRMRAVLTETRADALLLRGSEGEPFANPRRPPRLECFAAGARSEPFDAEPVVQAALPPALGATSTATWTAAALAGEHPIPQPIVNQLACCLLGARRTAA
jgi:anthranilate phosphoribosyltransferase